MQTLYICRVMSIFLRPEGCLASERLKLNHLSYDALSSHRTSPLTKVAYRNLTKRVKRLNAKRSSTRTLLRVRRRICSCAPEAVQSSPHSNGYPVGRVSDERTSRRWRRGVDVFCV